MTPKPPLSKVPAPPQSQVSVKKLELTEISDSPIGQRIGFYGPGGIGKTTLCAMMPGPVAFVDADESLARLKGQLREQQIPLPSVIPVSNWKELREVTKADGYGKIKTVVYDTATKIEEWCLAYTLSTVRGEKDKVCSRIEDYGFGKGYQHVYETFLHWLGDLDRLARKGINVVLVAHECVKNVPNPEGEDWIRYEPRLQDPTSGKASIRLRVKEWADHLLFLGYDVAVKDRRASGGGTRTIYTAERPHCMAKSRTTQEPIIVEQGVSPWEAIFK